MINEGSTTPAAWPATTISVHLRSVLNRVRGECAWGAVILAGNSVGEEVEQISSLCTAEGPYDANILGASAVLDHIKSAYADCQPQSIVIYADKGLCEGIDRIAVNGGRPTGKPAFRPLWTHLYELVRETRAIFRRMPTGGRAAEISDYANEAARKVVGLSVDPQKQSIGKVACPSPGCETPCEAYLMNDGRWRAWCQRCRRVFFTDPSGGAPSGS